MSEKLGDCGILQEIRLNAVEPRKEDYRRKLKILVHIMYIF